MGVNLFITYDLIYPGQYYQRVQDAIKSLGRWYQFQYSHFYVSTSLSPLEAYWAVRAVMDRNDKLTVVRAECAVVDGLSQADLAAINAIWFGGAIPKAA